MYNIAIVGVTGSVGRELVKIIERSSMIINKVFAYASSKSVGKTVYVYGKKIEIEDVSVAEFQDIDIAFFATDDAVSSKYVEVLTKSCKLIIDLSSFFRMSAPLIVSDVNCDTLNFNKDVVVANPNCVAIPVSVALKKLHDYAEVCRIVLSSYQSVSGAGRHEMNNLYTQSSSRLLDAFSDTDKSSEIAFNVIPKIGEFSEGGYTLEEIKVRDEVKKILSKDIDVSATCVRVPVFIGHSVSVNVEFVKDIDPDAAYQILSSSGDIILDKENSNRYFTPADCVGKDEVFVSRIRQDVSKNILNLWIVSDNLRRGAALNAVRIAEKYQKFMQ